jgi:hypothetical protein
MEKSSALYVGDLVTDGDNTALILETHVNMWGEEVIPTGVMLLWPDGDISVVYEDEIEVLNETCME